MNYYPHHIGDYARDTAHLTLLEDGAYRRMLDLCYASERPLPLDREKLYRLLRVRALAEKQAVDVILGEFFIEGEDGWHHKRVEHELARAHEKSEKARESAAKRWHSEGNAKAMRTHTEGNAPNSQEPIARVGRGTRLPPDWRPSEELLAWAKEARPDLNLEATVDKFRDYWHALPGTRGVKLDWGKTFRNWVREEKPGRGGPPAGPLPAVDLGKCACGAPATLKVGNSPRCAKHARGFEAAA